ncbi:FKBP-type peptidyl-prolyl cis-trans isomerase [Aeoliella sp. SH292]|jgi:FKBP-type peptidyl-prolyl cis-trans isomerase SlyD|uniref:FKBP-type peptidyl-prolyl cis-trans isomerase n=1 Tax=Aeoliella sp. SH292 TaxID=3454464 RepID=UPI003F946639
MQIADKSVVAIDYTLTDDQGEVIDSSEGGEPLWYLHGFENIVPGLERELTGKKVGDQFQVSISPVDGYGERDAELEQEIARDQFEDVDEIEQGMQFHAETDEGYLVFTVIEVGDDMVTVDGNHPLAGMTLNFDVTVREIRSATPEEIEHGHVHGPGGHHHH